MIAGQSGSGKQQAGHLGENELSCWSNPVYDNLPEE